MENGLDVAGLGDRYRIGQELGRGGMAVVYLAEDLKHGRDVAIKVITPEISAAVGGERFLQEIRVMAALQHPNILPLYDSGEANGLLYYVMPPVEGQSLNDRLQREKQLPIDEAIEIGARVADALQYAHDRDVLHRDVKPANILLHRGVPMVADFGVALALDRAGADRMTGTGLSIGTTEYMSPEQAGADRQMDGRADQYSLACVVYETLTGEPPFTGPTAASIIAKMFVNPAPRASTTRDTVSPALDEVLLRGLAKAPADRYESIADFGKALDSARSQTATSMAWQRVKAAHNAIAVLPFANMSPDPEDEYLSDGISEELIHALSKLEDVRVVARTSAFAFKSKNVDVRTIGKELNVGTVLEGSVRRSGKRIRVTAQLVSAEDGYELWSDRYEREVDDMFAVQDEVVHAIVETCVPALLGQPLDVAHTSPKSFEAYEHYLKGRYHWNRRTETGLRKSVQYLNEAVEMAPDYALALAGLADSYTTMGIYGADAPRDVMPLAKSMAEKALAVDDSLSEALTALACVRAVYDWDWSGSERDFKQAIEANAQYPTAYQWFAVNCLAPRGRFDEAREQLAKAESLDPIAPVVHLTKGLLSYLEGSYERATDELMALIDMDATFGMAHYFFGQVQVQQGKLDDALATLQTATQLTGDTPEIISTLAHAQAVAGRTEEAEALLTDLHGRASDRFVSPALIAQVYAGLGDRDQAFEWLENAYKARAPELIWIGVRPTYAPLANDPRMLDLRGRVGV